VVIEIPLSCLPNDFLRYLQGSFTDNLTSDQYFLTLSVFYLIDNSFQISPLVQCSLKLLPDDWELKTKSMIPSLSPVSFLALQFLVQKFVQSRFGQPVLYDLVNYLRNEFCIDECYTYGRSIFSFWPKEISESPPSVDVSFWLNGIYQELISNESSVIDSGSFSNLKLLVEDTLSVNKASDLEDGSISAKSTVKRTKRAKNVNLSKMTSFWGSAVVYAQLPNPNEEILSTRQKLPAWAERQRFLDLIGQNQGLVVTGETGCGKLQILYQTTCIR
jgi:hypothetical protein